MTRGRFKTKVAEIVKSESLTVRRIVVKLNEPTRDGDSEIAVLTNVPPERADAIQIAEVYRRRWRIETAFQRLTEALTCEINALCDPQAALFCSGSLQRCRRASRTNCGRWTGCMMK